MNEWLNDIIYRGWHIRLQLRTGKLVALPWQQEQQISNLVLLIKKK